MQQPAARRRRQALRETLQRIVGLVREVRADALLCGGDLYEQERFSPDTAEFLRAVFAGLDPTPVFIAPGNHDWYGPDSLYHRTTWSPNVRIFRNDRLEAATLTDGLTLWGAAHRAPANTGGFLDGFAVDRGGVHLALFHGSERGWLEAQGAGKLPHAPFGSHQIQKAGLHFALLGHYHRPFDGACYSYPGNPDPLSFGEDGERGAVVATVEPSGTVGIERRTVAVTDAHDLMVDLTGCTNQQDVRDLVATAAAGLAGFARITLTGELAREIDLRPADLSTAVPAFEGVQVRTHGLRIGYDVASIKDEPTVRGQFVRDVMAADLSEDERRRVLITGLRALEGRSDLEVL